MGPVVLAKYMAVTNDDKFAIVLVQKARRKDKIIDIEILES